MHYDMIIIGMGLSGLMAAKTAVDAGKKVLLVGKGMGALALFSNTIDVLGTLPARTKLAEGLSRWVQDHPGHPYAKVGVEHVLEALISFSSLFARSYTFVSQGNENSDILTATGTLRSTYLVPNTMPSGTSLRKGEILFVGFKGFKDFYANYLAHPLNCRAITLSLSGSSHGELTATAIARLLEKDSIRKRIGEEVKGQLKGEVRAGFPALLGLNDPVAVKGHLESLTGAEVFEVPTLPPSIPGKRIFSTFKEGLLRKGASFLMGYPVSKIVLKGKRCEGIQVSHPPVAHVHTADRFILATGRFLGGGLVADEMRIHEPLFSLPVSQPSSRHDWFGRSFFDDHPIHDAGIVTDSSFQPVDERGERILENVWVAGSMLSHHNLIKEKSREGIEISTGTMAAKEALKA